MHKPYEVLRGIVLPGECGVVVSRIYNWLRVDEEVVKIKPASCVVSKQLDNNFGKFFVSVANTLAESAGVNIVLDGLEVYLKGIKKEGLNTGKFVEPYTEDWGKMGNFRSSNDLIYYRVADSLRLSSEKSKQKFQGFISIFECFELVYKNAISNHTIVIDFSAIRGADEESSGRESFIQTCRTIEKFGNEPTLTNYLKVLSDICSCIKRGGFRRHGALTTTLKYHSPLYEEYLNIPFGFLSHLKKGTGINEYIDIDLLTILLEKINKGEMFLEKFLGYSQGKELYVNVCRGLSIIAGDQCLVSPVNLGMCKTTEDIIKGFTEVTQFLCDVFEYQNKLQPLPDRQIAVGITGLANLLKLHGVKYREFISELAYLNRSISINGHHKFIFPYAHDDCEITQQYKNRAKTNKATELVWAIARGMFVSASIAEVNKMRAAIAIEPTASCSRRYKDYEGFDVCPNIDAPDVIKGIGIEKRHSETGVYDENGELITPTFFYGKDIEPASDLTAEDHFSLWVEFQKLMDSTGKSHGGSYEQWYELTVAGFYQWLDSPLKFMYYRRSIGTRHLEKGASISARTRLQAKRSGLVDVGGDDKPNACGIDNRESCEACD
jgi:hypothetical protein